MTREVLKMALAALEDLIEAGAEDWSEQRPCVRIGREVATAIKAALAPPEQETGLPSLKDLKRSIRHRAKTEGYPCHFCGKHFCNHGCLKD